ncbi:MAG: hypothetical protein GY870_14340 [archaeon]|nr:hypothetical protein [archaeon]
MTRKNYLEYRNKHRSRKKNASQGMTAAIILIAFIITAAGIAFVILTMGSNMQQELDTIGQEGSDSASSALQLEGGVLVAYDVTGNDLIDAFTFNLKVVLENGEVDLHENSIEIYTISAHLDQQRLPKATIANVAAFVDTTGGGTAGFDIDFYDAEGSPDSILEPGETASFLVQLQQNHGVGPGNTITIVIISGAAMIKIIRTMPVGFQQGATLLI